MNADQINILQLEFGLSYHVEYASLVEQLVGFKTKRVLEVSGNQPKGVIDSLSWLQTLWL